ncbi:MAG: hypothetical protein ABSA78_09590 [Candidatus Sulfotelmatobacter sp.]|jgi:hypothetical protein
MKKVVPLVVVLVAVGIAQAQDDHAARTVRPSDALIAQILNSLSRPTPAEVQTNDIKIPGAEFTRCDSYTQGNHTESDCSPHRRFQEVHQLILIFSVNGRSVKVVAGCSSLLGDRHCQGFGELARTALPDCHGDNPSVCTAKGSGIFQVEGRKRKHQYFVYPVEGGKPNHRYEIPVATVDDERLVDFDSGSWEPAEKGK